MNRKAVALATICLLAPIFGAARADDTAPADKLPEPALRFAKHASLRLQEAEREWLKLAETIAKGKAEFLATNGSTGTAREQAARHLAGAKKLLEDKTRMSAELARFKGLLTKAAPHYRDVAALSTAQAGEARALEVKDDYRELAKVYEAKALAAERRAKGLALPAGAKGKAEVIEEGNLFLERFLEALPETTAGDAESRQIAERIKKHGERCQALADELVLAIETLLQAAEAADVRAKVAARQSDVSTPRSSPPGTTGKAAAAPKKDLSALTGATWTAPVTIQGVQCVQVVRFSADGTCTQSLYREGSRGRGPLIGNSRVTVEWDAEGMLDVYQAGWAIERGEITLRGKDEWTYEILASVGNPKLAGTTLTFTRDGRTQAAEAAPARNDQNRERSR